MSLAVRRVPNIAAFSSRSIGMTKLTRKREHGLCLRAAREVDGLQIKLSDATIDA